MLAVSTSLELPDAALRDLVAAAPDGVLMVDRNGTIVLANPEIARLTGWTPAELLGQPVEVLVPTAQRAGHGAQREAYVAAPHSRPMGSGLRLVATRRDGVELPVEIMLAPMQHAGQALTVAFVRDATERHRHEHALEALNRELEAFSYSVAHDLRAPLRSIDGFARALLEDHAAQLDEVGRDHLERVHAAATRMGALIDDLMVLGRVSRAELHREPVDLARLVRAAEARLRRSHPERVVKVELDPELTVDADPRLLALAIDNLLDNAWKFTRRRPLAHIHVGRGVGCDGECYFVRDDGVGFDPALATRLFAPFERLHPARDFEGTGIGLATVARVIHRHGGRVWADATPGGGATFHFTLGREPARTIP